MWLDDQSAFETEALGGCRGQKVQGTENMGNEGKWLSFQISQIFHDNPVLNILEGNIDLANGTRINCFQ